MISTTLTGALLTLFLTPLASAQLLAQGLPTCAQSCQTLNQAAQACSGTASANQATWACFCQSGYLTTLYASPDGICDAFCTDPAQNQQVSDWYNSNCGTDNGASEHADDGSGGQTTVVVTSTSTSDTPTAAAAPTAATTAPAGAGAQATSATTNSGANRDQTNEGSWWDNHYKWVIMIIVLAIALTAIGILATWLKKRHDRKRDFANTSFNEGITTRGANGEKPAPGAAPAPANASQAAVAPAPFVTSPEGRDSPARTREAFMPYGYNYTRSESRQASQTRLASDDAVERQPPPPVTGEVGSGRSSPLARGATPVGDLERGQASPAPTGTPTPTGVKRKKVLVRERSVEDDVGKKSG